MIVIFSKTYAIGRYSFQSSYVQDRVHAQSLVKSIQQARNLKEFKLVYYEGVLDKINQREIFRNLPSTLQVLNVCGFNLSIKDTVSMT